MNSLSATAEPSAAPSRPQTVADVLRDLPPISEEDAAAWDRVMQEVKTEPLPPLREIDWCDWAGRDTTSIRIK